MYTLAEGGAAVETLLRYDKTNSPVPWLATAYKADATAKTITFTLRKGVKFHDGTDFNAAAVKWNLDQLVAAKTASASKIGSIDVLDDYTVRLNLTAWISFTAGYFAQSSGMIVPPTATQANGVDWAVRNPVGTGPFKFVNWQPAVSISYNKFDGYWQQGKPYLDSVRVVFITDDITRELSLRAGEVDIVPSLVSTNLAKLKTDGFNVVLRSAGVGTASYVPDSANAKSPFADVRVRQAAAYSIDNATLVKSIYGELGAVYTNQLTFPGYWAYNPPVVGYPYDPAKSKQLLTAAGYPNGFQTRMTASPAVSQQLSYSTAVQSYLKAVGIDATMDVLPQAQINELNTAGRTWQGLGTGRFNADPDWVSIVSSVFNGNGSFVNMLLPDDYTQAVNNALLAPDVAAEQKAAQEVMKLLVDKYCLIIPLYSQLDSMTSAPYVHDTLLLETAMGWTPENAWLAKK